MAKYNFINHYKQVYLKEKNKNMQLANEAASKEQALIELRQKYERIAGNPVIRLLTCMEGKPKEQPNTESKVKAFICDEDSVSVKQYKKEVAYQRNLYARWIMEHEREIQAGEALLPESEIQKETESKTEIVFLEDCNKNFSIGKTKKPYILFASKKGVLNTQAEKIVEEYFECHKEVHILYGAEDIYRQDEAGEKVRKNPWFKPAYSPETLLSFFYFGNVFAIRKEKFQSISWLGADNWKENVYDFVLKAEELLGNSAKTGISATDKVLFHANEEMSDDKEQVIKKPWSFDENAITVLWGYEKEFEGVKLEALKRRGSKGYVAQSNVPGVYSVCMEETEKVSIIILSKDNQEVLEQCVRSIRERTDYENMEIIVVDNGSYETNRLKSEELSRKYDFTFICEPMDFNFSAMCNIGARAATGKYLLLLNDDIEVFESGWLKKMAGQASVKGVGAVGAKLWYPDSFKIQHAGITNLAIGPAHKLVKAEDNKMYYDGRNYFTFNYLAVTGACLMIQKDLYEQMGGLDESMPVAYNDVEFCFRLHKNGYRNVLRNDCILYHHESLSRGLDEENEEKAMRLSEERKRLYEKYPAYAGADEYYSPWLVQDAAEYDCAGSRTEETWMKPLTESNMMKKAVATEEEELISNIESASVAEDKATILGWSILRGTDNCHYKRSLILESVAGKKVYTSEIKSCLRIDVQKAYAQEIRAKLAGIYARFSVKNLEHGQYKIGILYEDMLSDNVYYRMTEHYLEI